MSLTPGRRWTRLWRRDPRSDVGDELRFHLDLAIDEGIAAGLSPDDARAAAHERFGDVATISATLHHLSLQGERIVHRKEWLEAIAQDARYGVRQLRRSPGFTLIALLTLALGIGANTAIFSLINAVLLQPLAFAEPARLVDIAQMAPSGSASNVVPYPNYLAWSHQAKLFTAIGATTNESFTLTGVGDPQRISGLRASAPYWRAFESPPIAGRYFTDAEDQPNGPRVVVLSYPFFQSTFGGDRTIVGRTIDLDGLPYTVIGVASPAYAPVARSVWVPLAVTADESQRYGDHELDVVGRLRPGVTVAAAVAELEQIERTVQAAHRDDGVNGRIVARGAVSALVGNDSERQFIVLLGAVGLVLLIACSNVANLLLARAVGRRGEMAVRSALGADRRRIVTQMLVESGVLALGGALLGVVTGTIVLRLLVASAPASIPRIQDAAINPRVLTFAVVVSVLAGLLFGLAPAWRASRTDLQTTLRASGRGGRIGNDPLRGALVVSEIALALVLLVGAGLLVRSALAMAREQLGFQADHLLVTRISLPATQYSTDTLVVTTYANILDHLRAVPGVTAAALVSRAPIAGFGADCGVRAPDAPGDTPDGVDAKFRSVSPGYFSTIGTPILRGRAIDATDASGGPLVAVINAQLSRKLFGSANPIGRQIRHCIGTGDGFTNQPTGANNPGASGPGMRTVVGVAADVHADGVNQDVVDEVYYPETQFFERTTTIVVRTHGSPLALLPGIRRAVAEVDPLLPLAGPIDMTTLIRSSTASPRFTMLLLLLLGGSGLLLAAIGIYGVIAYQVGQRTQELGVRLALGASAGQIIRLVVRQGLAVALVGVAVGELLALVAARVLDSLLYGVSSRDPVTFLSIGVLLTVIAIAASAIPAMRAARIDPLKALRG